MKATSTTPSIPSKTAPKNSLKSKEMVSTNSKKPGSSSSATSSKIPISAVPKRVPSSSAIAPVGKFPSTGVNNSKATNNSETIESLAKSAAKTPQKLSTSRYDKNKSASPFQEKKKKYLTSFSRNYDSGIIPCRIKHFSSYMALQWDQDINTVQFNPILVLCSEGLREEQHPYIFVAKQAFVELMKCNNAKLKIEEVLKAVVLNVRMALSSANKTSFDSALEAVELLAEVVQNDLVIFLDLLLGQISKKALTKEYKDKIQNLLQKVEMSCGCDAGKLIKAKVPTYCPL